MADLFVISRADIFAIYPQILSAILAAENAKRNFLRDFINLPTDSDYQERVYYRLLAVQKAINDLIDSGASMEEITKKKKIKTIWDPETQFTLSPLTTPSPASGFSLRRKKCIIDDPMDFLTTNELSVWSLFDLAMAAKLLRKPPIACDFSDEHVMRRVFSMIYDVYRYKHILSQALLDADFYQHHPQLYDDQNRVWLLLYELFMRHFLERDPKERIREKELYCQSNIEDIHKCVWDERIHLAASIARLRIKNNALSLMHLLPTHLQDNKVAIATANPIVTGWMNPFRLRTKSDARTRLTANGFIELPETDEGEMHLKQNHFKWDKVCPLFISCIPLDRSDFAKTTLMMDNQFIMMDRAFAIGPAIFSRLLEYFEIEGDVVQTHLSSPRSVAYLAALFECNYRVNDIIVYGAGSRYREYTEYMNKLGINNIRIRSEQFGQVAIQSQALEKVVGIFATPPNSYSAVADPIDLICSRGGDLSMLEVLTESEMSESSKDRVAKILEEQRESLRLSMARPQVQFVLYETHSMVDTENKTMVELAVDSNNRSAHSKHVKIYKEKKRMEALAEMDDINAEQWEKLQGATKRKSPQNQQQQQQHQRLDELKHKQDSASSSDDEDSESSYELLETSRSVHTPTDGIDDDYSQIKMPKTDLFEIVEIPDICQYQNKCLNLKNLGCFLSLIQRRAVTRLDEKHLILMAERRGLFGDPNPKKDKGRPPPKTVKKEEKIVVAVPKVKPKKSEDISLLIDRVSQPTHSSISRSHKSRRSSAENKPLMFDPNECEYFARRQVDSSSSEWIDTSYMASINLRARRIKLWWNETYAYLKLAGIRGRSGDSEKRSCEIFNDIKRNKIQPLKLSRRSNSFEDKTTALSPRRTKSNRTVYPLAKNCIEFDEIIHI